MSKKAKFYKKWYFWVAIVLVLLAAVASVLLLLGYRIVTICTDRTYNGADTLGSCTNKETVIIVASPELPVDCPDGTTAVFDSAGGVVGNRFVGCK